MKQGIGRLAPAVASWVSCALVTAFACAAMVACGGDVEPTDSDESDLSRSATTTPAPAEKEAPPAPAAPARAATTREESSSTPSNDLGNQGIGAAANDDKSDKQIKRPPE
jgi:hypothetical protein